MVSKKKVVKKVSEKKVVTKKPKKAVVEEVIVKSNKGLKVMKPVVFKE